MTSLAWSPVVNPPVLPPFCDLSEDAQLVLRVIQAEHEKKKEILMNRALQRGPVNYYSSIYRNSFHADIPRASNVRVRREDLREDPVLPVEMPTSPSLFSHYSTQHSIQGDDTELLLNMPALGIIPQTIGEQSDNIPDDTMSIVSNDFSIPTDDSSCLSKENNELSVMSINTPSNEFDTVVKNIIPLLADISSPDESSLSFDVTHVDDGAEVICDKLNRIDSSERSCPSPELLINQENCTSLSSYIQKPAVKRKLQLASPGEDDLVQDISVLAPKSVLDEAKSLGTLVNRSSSTPAKFVRVGDRASQEDIELDVIEKLLADDGMKTKASRKFKAPFKPDKTGTVSCKLKVAHQSSACGTKQTSGFEDRELLRELNMHNVQHQCDEERARVSGEVLSSEEVLLTLIYTDCSTQLMCQHKKKQNIEESRKGLAVGYQSISFKEDPLADLKSVQAEPLHCLYIPLTQADTDPQTFKWAQQFIQRLMTSSVRKISFLAKDLIGCLLDTFHYDTTEVISSWILLDPKIAAWLLDPDHPVHTFQDLQPDKQHMSVTQKVHNNSIKQLMCDFRLMASIMLQLFHKLKSRELWPLFLNLETRLIPLLSVMERRQIRVDLAKFSESSEILQSKLSKLEKKAHTLAGHSFSIKSHLQLRQVLFEELRLDEKAKDKRKISTTSVNHLKSTSEVVLAQLSVTHPLPAIILEYRQLQKLKSTYVDGLRHCVDDGFIHTHWDQTAAATGRLTSYQPNLQSVPKQPVLISDYRISYIAGSEPEKESCQVFARDPFISDENSTFVAADFQQIELRLLAHLADDPKLLSVFQNPSAKDIFMELTAQWLGKPLSDVTQPEREQTKRVVYSVMYGAGKEKLADYLKIDVSHAKAIMTSFLDKFPAINSFTKTSTQFCQTHGYVCTIFKRRRLIPNITSKSPVLRAQAERQAVNFSVQGSAADICKAAMLQVEAALVHKPHIKARLLLQIHDELLYEVLDQHLDEFKDLVTCVMESSDTLCGDLVKLRVPLSVSLSIGKSWGHLREGSSSP